MNWEKTRQWLIVKDEAIKQKQTYDVYVEAYIPPKNDTEAGRLDLIGNGAELWTLSEWGIKVPKGHEVSETVGHYIRIQKQGSRFHVIAYSQKGFEDLPSL